MRWLLVPVLLLGCVMRVKGDTFVYVSMTPENKIQVLRLDPKDGKLTPVETVAVEGTPGALSADPKQKYLFATLRSTCKLASFKIDPATGKLKAIGSVSLPSGEDAAFTGTDRTGRWLLSASYGAGKVFVHKINDDGSIQGPAVQAVKTAKTAHFTATDPSNAFVLVPHVKPNAVWQFKLDAASGKLTAAGKGAGGPDKAGPRHLVFHPTLPMAFTSDEHGSSITAYRFDADKGLKPEQTLSTVPSGTTGKNAPAEIKMHPTGKFVWVSNRGHDSLAGFAIDKAGKLTSIGTTPTEAMPRAFEIEPDGKFLLSAGQRSGKVTVYQIDADTGKLTKLESYAAGKAPQWVRALKFEK